MHHLEALEALNSEFNDVSRQGAARTACTISIAAGEINAEIAGDYYVLPEGDGTESGDGGGQGGALFAVDRGDDCDDDDDVDDGDGDASYRREGGYTPSLRGGRGAASTQPLPRAGSGGAGVGAGAFARIGKLAREFAGKGRGALLERVALELPDLKAEEVEVVLERISRKKGYKRRRGGLIVAWEARRQVPQAHRDPIYVHVLTLRLRIYYHLLTTTHLLLPTTHYVLPATASCC